MRCAILLFAQLAEAVGRDRLTLELSNGATVGDALHRIALEHPAVADMRDALAVAVNDRYCPGDTALADGDTIALIPPVSGG